LISTTVLSLIFNWHQLAVFNLKLSCTEKWDIFYTIQSLFTSNRAVPLEKLTSQFRMSTLATSFWQDQIRIAYTQCSSFLCSYFFIRGKNAFIFALLYLLLLEMYSTLSTIVRHYILLEKFSLSSVHRMLSSKKRFNSFLALIRSGIFSHFVYVYLTWGPVTWGWP